MNFYTDFLVKSSYFHNRTRVTDLAYLEPITRAAIENILADSAAAGQPLILFETYRSPQRQQFLFDQKATQLKEVGVHGYGLAADLVKDLYGQPSWAGDFMFLADLAKKHGLISGLDWGHYGVKNTFVDACHVQRIRVDDQAKLFNGTWFPENDYSPYKMSSVDV
jgi:hypothetical protein